jgi:hypothetical protein
MLERLFKTPFSLAIGLILLSLLACVGSTPESQPTSLASFSTVTPGGRISVSLLTSTTTLEAVEQDSQVIGPVATTTALAALADSMTATALAPGSTEQPLVSAPARCPAAGSPLLPDLPPPFSQYAEVIAAYLSEGGATTILEATFRTWNAFSEFGGLVRADRDFTGDGVPEVLVVLLDPSRAGDFPQPGDLFIFGCDNGKYRLLFQNGYASDRGVPFISSADDVNEDFLNDLIYTTTTCQGPSCFTTIKAYSWNLTLGNFDSLLTNEIREPSARVSVSDVYGDPYKELIVDTGIIEDVNAGPQRTYTSIYRWNGTAYVLSERLISPSQYRIHVIYDADQALLDGDYDRALELYEDVVKDSTLLAWRYPSETEYLIAYARFKEILLYTLRGQLPAAQGTRDRLVEQYTVPVEGGEGGSLNFGALPGVEFARMADFWWGDFALNRDPGRSCQIVIGYIRANPTAIEVLNSFGFSNPTYTATDVCPADLGG